MAPAKFYSIDRKICKIYHKTQNPGSAQVPQAFILFYIHFIGVEEFPKVLRVFQESRKSLAEILSAFEFMDSQSMDVIKNNLKMSSPVTDFPFYILIETSGSNGEHDEEKLNGFLGDMMGAGLVCDGTVATEVAKIQVHVHVIFMQFSVE